MTHNGEKLEVFLLKLRTGTHIPHQGFKNHLEVLSNPTRKAVKCAQIGEREEMKLSVYSYDYLKKNKTKRIDQKFLELTRNFKSLQDTVFRSQSLSYTPKINKWNLKLKTQSLPFQNETLRYEPTIYVQVLYEEKYKTLMNESKELNKWKNTHACE
jgi:hypothetical protein